jgi:hypothetical protein
MTAKDLDAWRIVPRLLILSYMLVFYKTCTWFMELPDPTNAQAGFVSVIVGAWRGVVWAVCASVAGPNAGRQGCLSRSDWPGDGLAGQVY